MRNRIREQRIQQELSQAELATGLGVSRQTVISLESGRYLPSLDRKSTRLNSSHSAKSRMPSSA